MNSVLFPDNTASQIIHVTYNQAEQIIYLYDNNGNLICKQSPDKTLDLGYDYENRLTQGLSPQGTDPEVYYSYDGLGSVANLTDSSGANIQSYAYDAFGNTLATQELSSQGAAPANTHQFLTKETDPSGLIFFGARYYDPTLGRFITLDPTGMSDGPNMYVYVINDPINLVDLWGLCKKTGWWPKPLDIIVPGYRNYGGSIRSGPGDPEDLMDAVFQKHDVGYSKGDLNQADLQLLYDLSNLPKSPRVWGKGVNIVYAPIYRIGAHIIFATRQVAIETIRDISEIFH